MPEPILGRGSEWLQGTERQMPSGMEMMTIFISIFFVVFNFALLLGNGLRGSQFSESQKAQARICRCLPQLDQQP